MNRFLCKNIINITIIFPIIGFLTLINSCRKDNEISDSDKSRVKIVASFFPMEQFVMNVVKDVPGIEVETLLPASFGCPHDYYLNPGDMKSLSRADILVINGLGMENISFTDISNLNQDLIIIVTSSAIKSAIEISESADVHHHSDVNPHLFSSPQHAAMQVRKISKELSLIDTNYSELYLKNGEFYAHILDSLGLEFRKAAKGAKNNKIVTVHEVFDYLASDIGLDIVGTIESSPGQEPSAGEMLELVAKLKGVHPVAIFIEPQYPAEAAYAIAKEVGTPVYTLDPIASGPENSNSDYYVQTMIKNLETLRKAFDN